MKKENSYGRQEKHVLKKGEHAFAGKIHPIIRSFTMVVLRREW